MSENAVVDAPNWALDVDEAVENLLGLMQTARDYHLEDLVDIIAGKVRELSAIVEAALNPWKADR